MYCWNICCTILSDVLIYLVLVHITNRSFLKFSHILDLIPFADKERTIKCDTFTKKKLER